MRIRHYSNGFFEFNKPEFDGYNYFFGCYCLYNRRSTPLSVLDITLNYIKRI